MQSQDTLTHMGTPGQGFAGVCAGGWGVGLNQWSQAVRTPECTAWTMHTHVHTCTSGGTSLAFSTQTERGTCSRLPGSSQHPAPQGAARPCCGLCLASQSLPPLPSGVVSSLMVQFLEANTQIGGSSPLPYQDHLGFTQLLLQYPTPPPTPRKAQP